MSSKTKASKIRHGKDILSLNIVAYAFTGIVAILCLIPFIMIVSGSFSSEAAIKQKRLQPSAAGFFLRGI